MEHSQNMTESQLVNDLGLGGQTMFLLGAGCSISSGCKAASMLVKDFKIRIYCAENGIPLEDTASYSDEDIKRITDSMPSMGNDYSYYFEKCFPLPEARNAYIQRAFRECNPGIGYLCFANYILSNQVKNIATTNFDRLVYKALSRLSPNTDIEEISESSKTIGEHSVRIISLHGDWHYDLLRNTESELQGIGKELEAKFASYEYSKLVIIGYSGQDKSILKAIKAAIAAKPNLRLIWCCHESKLSIPDEVVSILNSARSTIACGIDFDNLFVKIYKQFGPRNVSIEKIINEHDSNTLEFAGALRQQQEFLLNGFRFLKLPLLYRSKEGDSSTDLYHGGDYYFFEPGFGRSKLLFSDANLPLSFKIHILNCFIERASKEIGLSCYHHRSLFKDDGIDGIKRSLEYKVSFIGGDFYLLFSPSYTFGREMVQSEKIAISIRSSGLYTQKNKEMLDKLINDFFGGAHRFHIGDNLVEFNSAPARIATGQTDFVYTQLNEPEMVVNGYEGKNQLGLTYEHQPTKCTVFQKSKIKMAVICPKEKKKSLNDFLQSFIKTSTGVQSSQTIYREFPGFESFTGVDLELAGDKKVALDSKVIESFDHLQFLDFMEDAIRQNYETQQPDIVLVYFTKEMERFRKVDGIDFHDALKARMLNSYKTQFLEESTLDFKDDKNKILVNLALAIYTKTICLPWTPKTFDKDKFFLGMAFGVTKKGLNVSCSQLFDGAGRGLMLLTSQVKDKNTKNPYLSEDEAYKLGRAIRAEYYKALKPYDLKKIVVHRTVPFKKEEINGFKKAFEGLDDFSLLQITEFPEENIYPLKKDGKIDGYPAKRGTAIKIDKESILLWTDGSVKEQDVLGFMTYRSSKRGMGKPIKIRKFHGKQKIEEIASDILNLTKMDFNSSDALYSRMPVTVKYAKIPSQILKYKDISDNSDLIDFRYVM